MKKVRVKVLQTGVCFACFGVIIARNGRRIWEGPLRGYGSDGTALEDALAEAKDRGWAVI